MCGSSGRNFTQSRPRSRVINPKPARMFAVIISARVTTNFTGRAWSHSGEKRRHNSHKNITERKVRHNVRPHIDFRIGVYISFSLSAIISPEIQNCHEATAVPQTST